MSMPRRTSMFRVTALVASLLFCGLSVARAAPGTGATATSIGVSAASAGATAVSAGAAAASTAAQAQDIYQQLRYRHIGPVGNRISAVAGIAGDPQ